MQLRKFCKFRSLIMHCLTLPFKKYVTISLNSFSKMGDTAVIDEIALLSFEHIYRIEFEEMKFPCENIMFILFAENRKA